MKCVILQISSVVYVRQNCVTISKDLKFEKWSVLLSTAWHRFFLKWFEDLNSKPMLSGLQLNNWTQASPLVLSHLLLHLTSMQSNIFPHHLGCRAMLENTCNFMGLPGNPEGPHSFSRVFYKVFSSSHIPTSISSNFSTTKRVCVIIKNTTVRAQCAMVANSSLLSSVYNLFPHRLP